MSVPSPFSERPDDELIQIVARKNQNEITDTTHPFYQDAMLAIFELRKRPRFNWRVMNILKHVPGVDRDEIIDKVWEGVEKNFRYGNSSMFLGYVTTTARNRWKDYIKSKSVKNRVPNIPIEGLARTPEDPEKFDEDKRGQFRDCVEKLRAYQDGRLYDVLRLRKLEGKGYDEICAELNIPRGSAHGLCYKAVQRVKDCLRGKGSS
jgi:RNA polymerase sigma factor (sigma-70 family)